MYPYENLDEELAAFEAQLAEDLAKAEIKLSDYGLNFFSWPMDLFVVHIRI